MKHPTTTIKKPHQFIKHPITPSYSVLYFNYNLRYRELLSSIKQIYVFSMNNTLRISKNFGKHIRQRAHAFHPYLVVRAALRCCFWAQIPGRSPSWHIPEPAFQAGPHGESPESPTSPIKAVSLGTPRLRKDDTIETAIARSAACSRTLMPPATFTKISC